MNIHEIKKQISQIDEAEMYTPEEITNMGILLNSSLKPCLFSVYRLIRNGKIKAANLGIGTQPRYMVLGKELKEFLSARYKIQDQS